MKFYLITQYQKDTPILNEFNSIEEMKKYVNTLGSNLYILPITDNVNFVKIRENKVDEFHE